MWCIYLSIYALSFYLSIYRYAVCGFPTIVHTFAFKKTAVDLPIREARAPKEESNSIPAMVSWHWEYTDGRLMEVVWRMLGDGIGSRFCLTSKD